MLATIKIEDKEIPMISNGGTLKEYRHFFKRDLIGDFIALENAFRNKQFQKVDSLSLAQMMWTCAHRANDKIKPFDEWIEQFESPFSIFEHMEDFLNLINGSAKPTVEPKKKKNQKNK